MDNTFKALVLLSLAVIVCILLEINSTLSTVTFPREYHEHISYDAEILPGATLQIIDRGGVIK